MKTYLKNLLLAFFFCLGIWACGKNKNIEPKTSGSKVQVTFEEVPDGAWIQLDDNEKFYHYLDTNKFVDQPDGLAIIQTTYPRDMPLIEDFSNGWVSEKWNLGFISVRWRKSFASGGLSAYSLFRNLTETRALANPYGIKPSTTQMQYKISFENIKTFSDSLQYYYSFPDGQGFSDKRTADKYAVLNIERLDGKDIKIQTSEGYKIKIEYQ
ncbi:hypothetical protein [Thermoflexibacter ruber]|uniref:NigD-like protein n=1 Tax=Thermoflexibacter ruber TaxID=1003 RepID=A0A1I2D2N5_9BACT|nr:hypothetical protein [Thermoflexibacter ruber]SFE74817.1 hypothetical protein SAMN04488541_100638 [Thermoflexibacter ruber]